MLHRFEEGKIKQYVAKYQNPDATRRDVLAAISNYSGLACKQEHFVFNDGRQVELLNLDGTIPVRYKGSVYNIPVCIWLMDTHPNNAPMCYVKPTADMQIKPSMFVDQNGRIYLPYLHEWSPNSSDLMGLIQVMVVTFGEQPPVYAKSRGSNAMPKPYPPTSFMPVPGGSGPGTTPYPVFPTGTPYPTPSSGSYQPPYPPYPPSSGSSTGFPPYPPSYPSFPGGGAGGGYPYPPSHMQGTPQSQSGGATGTITEEHIRLSLLSAVEDKLRRRMAEQLSQAQAELETLRRTQRELAQGRDRLDDILGRMEKEQLELDKNISILKDKEQELEKSIARLSEQEPIDVDEAVTTTTPLYKQLLNAFAEEAAIEDTIYYMGEALRRGVVDLDVFLKQVRALSRRQFMLRALMHKCRERAGLAG
ncbi:tumor susceptibility gene 101 protein [Bacillus rossius redtenbacheri]|uniref:tumor susceptibility gene 101 protein n=1 Tax=Bacillus rossius redtenbacheri TaxID=93214 RepID=UPI002FDE4FA4